MRRILAIIGVTAVLGMGATYVATAGTTPDPVNACVTKSTGAVRIVATTGLCKSSEARLSWNLSGPPGTPGTAGSNGVSGYEVVTNADPESAQGFFGSAGADCPSGKNVTGGGAIALTTTGGVQNGFRVLNSSPNDTNTGWRATFDISNPLGDDFVLKVTAMCATVTP